ncbi:sister chromatid cohesion protein solo [Drosophila bipectinata]|uniref:sister chromatid cohesion protein solo n=1 Tax=Drosophila bipectinata TaxID=42026 RepID=UPI0038B2B03C
MRETAAKMDSFILEIDNLLNNVEDPPEPAGECALAQWQRGVNELHENLDEELFAVPSTPPSKRRASRRRAITDEGRTSREPNASHRREVNDSREDSFIRKVKEMYMNALDRSRDSLGGDSDSDDETLPSEAPRPTYVPSSRNRTILNEDYMILRDCRLLRYPNMQEYRRGMPWPDVTPQSWLLCPRPRGYGIRKSLKLRPEEHQVRRAPVAPVDQHLESNVHVSGTVHMPRQQQSQNQEFLEGVSTNQLDSFRDEDMVLSSSRVLSQSAMRASSTPLRRINEHNRRSFFPSTIDSPDHQLSLPDGSLGAPPLPAEFPLVSDAEGSTLVLPADTEETALVDPPSVLRSRVGVTPSSVSSFQPLLPAIHEEQRLELNSGFSDTIRELRSTAAASVAPEPEPASVSRDWASIFRTREEVMNYNEGSAPANPRQRRRRVRRPRGARPPPRPTTPELVVPPEVAQSNHNVTTNFLADLLEQASEMEKELRMEFGPEAQVTQAEPEAVRKSADESHQKDKSVNEIFPPAAPTDVLSSTALTSDGAPPPKESTTLNNTSEILTSMNISNISHAIIDPPTLPPIVEAPSLDETPCLPSTSEKAVVTSVEIIQPPINVDPSQILHQINQSDGVSDIPIPTAERATGVTLSDRRKLVYNEAMECYAYVVKHIDLFSLIIRQKKELCDQSGTDSNGKDSKKKYISTPSTKFYNTQVIFNVPARRTQIVSGIMIGLVTQPSMDIQKAPFVKSRMDAAITFRYLLDLKAKNFINLSADGRLFSLR